MNNQNLEGINEISFLLREYRILYISTYADRQEFITSLFVLQLFSQYNKAGLCIPVMHRGYRKFECTAENVATQPFRRIRPIT